MLENNNSTPNFEQLLTGTGNWNSNTEFLLCPIGTSESEFAQPFQGDLSEQAPFNPNDLEDALQYAAQTNDALFQVYLMSPFYQNFFNSYVGINHNDNFAASSTSVNLAQQEPFSLLMPTSLLSPAPVGTQQALGGNQISANTTATTADLFTVPSQVVPPTAPQTQQPQGPEGAVQQENKPYFQFAVTPKVEVIDLDAIYKNTQAPSPSNSSTTSASTVSSTPKVGASTTRKPRQRKPRLEPHDGVVPDPTLLGILKPSSISDTIIEAHSSKHRRRLNKIKCPEEQASYDKQAQSMGFFTVTMINRNTKKAKKQREELYRLQQERAAAPKTLTDQINEVNKVVTQMHNLPPSIGPITEEPRTTTPISSRKRTAASNKTQQQGQACIPKRARRNSICADEEDNSYFASVPMTPLVLPPSSVSSDSVLSSSDQEVSLFSSNTASNTHNRGTPEIYNTMVLFD